MPATPAAPASIHCSALARVMPPSASTGMFTAAGGTRQLGPDRAAERARFSRGARRRGRRRRSPRPLLPRLGLLLRCGRRRRSGIRVARRSRHRASGRRPGGKMHARGAGGERYIDASVHEDLYAAGIRQRERLQERPEIALRGDPSRGFESSPTPARDCARSRRAESGPGGRVLVGDGSSEIRA